MAQDERRPFSGTSGADAIAYRFSTVSPLGPGYSADNLRQASEGPCGSGDFLDVPLKFFEGGHRQET